MIKKKILAISGSTRERSTNLSLIYAIKELSKEVFEIEVFNEIAGLPQFNPDHDIDPAPQKIFGFRKLLKEADGVLICTPEYAMGVPGTLKNAIDWTVSSAEFSKKPVALITASSMGEKAHTSLLETLKIIEGNITGDTQLLISFAKTKINSDTVITDKETLEQVKKLIKAFSKLINHE
ncbi:MAG: NAD(P)H-dependent oxidoreductase [Bacteroidetes bacterium]|nr:NAD(P)H-dependent oxidoreductase [Bacteroidota bacterium]